MLVHLPRTTLPCPFFCHQGQILVLITLVGLFSFHLRNGCLLSQYQQSFNMNERRGRVLTSLSLTSPSRQLGMCTSYCQFVIAGQKFVNFSNTNNHWQLRIYPGGSIYTREISKHYKSALLFFYLRTTSHCLFWMRILDSKRNKDAGIIN